MNNNSTTNKYKLISVSLVLAYSGGANVPPLKETAVINCYDQQGGTLQKCDTVQVLTSPMANSVRSQGLLFSHDVYTSQQSLPSPEYVEIILTSVQGSTCTIGDEVVNVNFSIAGTGEFANVSYIAKAAYTDAIVPMTLPIMVVLDNPMPTISS